VSATDGKFTDKVRVTWSASSWATYYEFYRNTKNNSAGATLINSVGATAYNDLSAVAGKVYWYFAKACNDSGCSSFSLGDTGYRALNPYVPITVKPSGTILDTTPTFQWTKVTSAIKYRYQLYTGTTLVYTKTAQSSVCGMTYCKATPLTVLKYQKYKWRVSAYVGGVWKPWSTYRFFTVAKTATEQSQ
jgi:fibronectin type 3 domain-containing protein